MKKTIAILLAAALLLGLAACGSSPAETTVSESATGETAESTSAETTTEEITETTAAICDSEEKAGIEEALDLSNIKPEWTYSEEADAWTMAVVTAVTNYVFGSTSADARHWDKYVLKVFEENQETLAELFNK